MRSIILRFFFISYTLLVLMGCNTKNQKPESNKSPNSYNNENYSYPAPSENAADVAMEEVEIGSPNSMEREGCEEGNMRHQQPTKGHTATTNKSTDTFPRNEMTDDANENYYPDELQDRNITRDSFSNTRTNSSPNNRIGASDTTEQQELRKRDRVSGNQSSDYTDSSQKSGENIGPIFNVGAKTASERVGELDQELRDHLETFDKDLKATRNIESGIDNSRSDAGDNQASSSSDSQLEGWGFKDRKPLGNRDKAGYEPPPRVTENEKDDDIVARQLREAASAEQDPLLREKLWAEYKRYKSGL